MSEDKLNLKPGERAVVVEGGRIVSTHDTESQAKAEAERRKRLAESAGQPAPSTEVKQTLLG